jgi:tetratricopeptide (TPR) repeat protein
MRFIIPLFLASLLPAQSPAYRRVPAPHAAPGEKENALAAGYLQKLRETGDGGYLTRAGALVEQVLARDGRNYEALVLRNQIALNRHEFRRVADESRRLAELSPRDARNWGSLGDALMELGAYDAAADAYQKMVNLRPGLASYNRVAFYRWVTGDAEGAIAAMRQAIGAGGSTPENVAWCLVDLGSMYFKTGQLDDALNAYAAALRQFPGYHRAYAGLGQALAARGWMAEAAEYYRRAQGVVPLPEYAGALVELYRVTGKADEARKQNDLIDMLDRMAQANQEKTNRNLALAFADQNRKVGRALELASAELESRRDVYSYDALAWALYRNGNYTEAEKAAAQALKTNATEPLFYYHAGMIAAAMGRQAEAGRCLERALTLNPRFDPRQAAVASSTLAGLRGAGPLTRAEPPGSASGARPNSQ